MSQGLLGSNQLTTIDQSELSTQLGLGLGGGNLLQRPQSPEPPLPATASPTSSLQDDDMDDFRRVSQYNFFFPEILTFLAKLAIKFLNTCYPPRTSRACLSNLHSLTPSLLVSSPLTPPCPSHPSPPRPLPSLQL